MKSSQAALDQNRDALPIVRPSFSRAKKLTLSDTAAVNTEALEAGAYVVTLDVDAFLSIGAGAVASDEDGSILLSAGVPYHTLAFEGERLSLLGKEPGAAYFAPLL